MNEFWMGLRFGWRFWLAAATCVSSSGLAAITTWSPQWIEVVLRRDPDGGDASVERTIGLLLFGLSAVLCALAVMELRRHVTSGNAIVSPSGAVPQRQPVRGAALRATVSTGRFARAAVRDAIPPQDT